MRRALAIVTLLALCAAGCGSHGTSTRAGPSPVRSPSPSPSAAVSTSGPQPVAGKVMLGAYLELAGKTLTQSLALRRSQLGRGMRIVHLYFEWTDGLLDWIDVVPPGSIPMLSWSALPAYTSVTDGSQDALIRRQAQAVAAYRRPLFLRWGWEMNGDWFPWSGAKNRTRGAGYIAAWRHIHDIFAAAGATNVAWVWSPNYFSEPAQAWNDMTKYYPGDAYVDWVGTSGYSYGRQLPEFLFGRTYKTYAPRKPIMISEVGIAESGGTTRPDWIRALATWIVAHPVIAALVWFDTDTYKGTNWRLDTTPAGIAAFRELANDPHFAG
ncbi:MAG: hypothetical protein V7603_6496 [Micromonosporaceae bacterium]